MIVRKQKIITLSLIVLFVIVTVAGAWAFKSGKFVGLADIIKTTEKGVTITTKDSGGNLISGVYIHTWAHYSNNSWSEDSNLSGSTVDGKFLIYPPNLTDNKYHLFCESSSPITALKFKPELTGSTFSPAESDSISKDNICSTLTEITFIASSGPTGGLTGAIYGYVSNDSGNGLNSVRVAALINGQEIDFTSTGNDANGTAGYYLFASLAAPYTYTIKAEKTGYNSAEASVALKSGDNVQKDLEMSLKPDETKFIYMAEVVDSVSGNLIKNVSVTITANPTIPGFGSWSGTTKGEAVDPSKYDPSKYGNVNLVAGNLPQDNLGCYSANTNYTVSFSDSDYESQQLIFNCNQIKLDQGLNSYVFNAGKISLAGKKINIILSGRISDQVNPAQSLEGAAITLKSSLWPASQTMNATSGRLGFYQIKNIPYDSAATYTATIKKQDYQRLEEDFQMTPDSDLRVHKSFAMVLAKGNYVYGLVVDDRGRPIENAKISVVKNGEISSQFGTTNSDGYYSIDGVSEGKNLFRAFHINFSDNDSSRKEAEVKNNQPTEVDFNLLRLPGQDPTFNLTLLLEGQDTNQKITWDELSDGGVWFEITSENPETGAWWTDKYSYQDLTLGNLWGAENGTVKIPVKPGQITVKVDLDGYETKEINFDHDSTQDISKTISLKKSDVGVSGSGIEGIVNIFNRDCSQQGWSSLENRWLKDTRQTSLNGDNLSPPGINIDLFDHTGQKLKTIAADENGYFSFDHLQKGDYKVAASSNFYQAETNVSINKDKDWESVLLELTKKDNIQPTLTKTVTFNGIKIKFVGYEAQKDIDSIDWDKITSDLKSIKNKINPTIEMPDIYLVESAYPDKWTWTNPDTSCFQNNSGRGYGIVLTTSYLENNVNIISSVIAHEFAHYYDYRYLRADGRSEFLKASFDAANSLPGVPRNKCPFERIKDANIRLETPGSGSGHPWDGETEFFASFFQAFYRHHGYLYGVIKYHTQGNCQNVLAYMWEFFSQEIGPVDSNDAQMFSPRGGRLKIISPANIVNGSWRADLAKNQPLTERATSAIKYNLDNATLNLIIKKASMAMQKAANYIEKLFFWQKRGSIKVTIEETIDNRSMPVTGAIVHIGGFCTTNENGQCAINNVKAGEQKIKIYQKDTLAPLEVVNQASAVITTTNITANQMTEQTFIVR